MKIMPAPSFHSEPVGVDAFFDAHALLRVVVGNMINRGNRDPALADALALANASAGVSPGNCSAALAKVKP